MSARLMLTGITHQIMSIKLILRPSLLPLFRLLYSGFEADGNRKVMKVFSSFISNFFLLFILNVLLRKQYIFMYFELLLKLKAVKLLKMLLFL